MPTLNELSELVSLKDYELNQAKNILKWARSNSFNHDEVFENYYRVEKEYLAAISAYLNYVVDRNRHCEEE